MREQIKARGPEDIRASRFLNSFYIYFVSDGTGAVKVGLSREKVEKRLSTLQTGNHRELKIFHYIETHDSFAEKEIHGLLSYCHIRGEWFRIPKHILKLIKKHNSADSIITALKTTRKETINPKNKTECVIQLDIFKHCKQK